jgi:hypothetical protein
MDVQDLKMNCLHLASNLLGANNHAALAWADNKQSPTPEEVTTAAEKLFKWVKE